MWSGEGARKKVRKICSTCATCRLKFWGKFKTSIVSPTPPLRSRESEALLHTVRTTWSLFARAKESTGRSDIDVHFHCHSAHAIACEEYSALHTRVNAPTFVSVSMSGSDGVIVTSSSMIQYGASVLLCHTGWSFLGSTAFSHHSRHPHRQMQIAFE
jgi:hypothetical protein